MAKNFPYFKFTVSEWLTGDIVFEDYDVQGLFINICAIYWQRDGRLSLQDINLRYKNPTQLDKLTDRFISVTDGFISVKFLDEQLIEAGHISKVNSENGKKGGRPKALITLEKKPTANRPLTETKAKKSKEEQEQELNKKIIKPILFKDSKIFDKNNFKDSFPEWTKEKLIYYYDSVLTWSNEGHKKIDWVATVRNWAAKDEKEGKIKFTSNSYRPDLSGLL